MVKSFKSIRKAVIAYFVWAMVGLYFDEVQASWTIRHVLDGNRFEDGRSASGGRDGKR